MKDFKTLLFQCQFIIILKIFYVFFIIYLLRVTILFTSDIQRYIWNLIKIKQYFEYIYFLLYFRFKGVVFNSENGFLSF